MESFGKGVMEENLVLSVWQDVKKFSVEFKELLTLGCVSMVSMTFTMILNDVKICLHRKGKHLRFSNLKLEIGFCTFEPCVGRNLELERQD